MVDRVTAFNPIEHPVCLLAPDRLTQSAWSQHVPFAMLLVDLVRPREIVELGTYLGASYCAFCQAVKHLGLETHCYGVDTWAGDEHGGYYGSGILADLRAHHDSRYDTFSTLIKSTFDDAVYAFADGSIDLLHIDGYHTYEAVQHDFETWLPKMSNRGVVLLHDISERDDDFGVWKLWSELKTRYSSHLEFDHGHGLGVVVVGTQVPEGLHVLLDAPAGERVATRELFHELGLRVESAYTVQLMQRQLDQNAAESTALEAQITERDQKLAEEEVRFNHALAQEKSERTILSRQHVAELSLVHNQVASLEARLGQALWQLNWFESSKGVRAIKLTRAAKTLLIRKGPFSLSKHAILWLFGRRGYNLRDINDASVHQSKKSQKPAILAASATIPQIAALRAGERGHRLPSPDSTFIGASIVIPVLNALDYARDCVHSIYAAGADIDFEVIVIDNGSRPDVLSWLQSESRLHPNFWYVSLAENLGFSKGINLGIEFARGQYIVLHNSDTVVTKGWLDKLVSALDNDPELGVVSPMTNYVGNGPQIAEDARRLPVDQADNYAASIATREGVEYIADRLVFFCVMIPRRVITMLGGLSGSYGLGNFEDDDYCVRTITAGYKLGIARNAFVYHHGSKTFTANKIDHDGILDRNRTIFVNRTSRLSSTPLPALWHKKAGDNPLVSVVLRTMDRPAPLRQALVSLANQTFDRFEVVVVNDGHEDVSQLLRDFEPRLKFQYIHHDNPRGASAALNTGLEAARGEWMAYLDDDDIVYPYHINALWSTLVASGSRFAYSDHTRVLVKTGPGGVPVPMLWRPIPTWEFSLGDLYVQDHLPIHTWMHSRSDALDVGGFRADQEVHEDWDLLLRLAQSSTFVPTRQVSAEYRFYVDTVSNSIIRRRSRSLELLEVMYERYPVPESSLDILEAREQVRTTVQSQINEIAALQEMAERGAIEQHDARSRMVAVVTGMEVEAPAKPM